MEKKSFMNASIYQQEFSQIEKKIIQVLRIKKKLVERRQNLIQVLRNSYNYGEIQQALSSPIEIYKRELRILSYCEKGLRNARIILDEVESLLDQNKSVIARFRPIQKSSFPYFGFAKKDPLTLLALLKLTHKELKYEINYISGRMELLSELISKQREYAFFLLKNLNKGIISGNKGVIFGNASQTKYFEELEFMHSQEINIIKKIGKKSKSDVLIALLKDVRKHPILASIQGTIMPLRVISTTATVGSVSFGIYYVPLFTVIGAIVQFSPMLVAHCLNYREL